MEEVLAEICLPEGTAFQSRLRVYLRLRMYVSDLRKGYDGSSQTLPCESLSAAQPLILPASTSHQRKPSASTGPSRKVTTTPSNKQSTTPAVVAGRSRRLRQAWVLATVAVEPMASPGVVS